MIRTTFSFSVTVSVFKTSIHKFMKEPTKNNITIFRRNNLNAILKFATQELHVLV